MTVAGPINAVPGTGLAVAGRRVAALSCLVATAFVLLPYAVLGESFEQSAAALLQEQSGRAAVAGLGAVLLAADMVLPIPSSIVATALGAALGWLAGTLCAAAGLTIGCVLGFVLGRAAARRVTADRPSDTDRYVVDLLSRYGTAALVLCRGVPVLAEASVIAAAALGMPAGRCLAATTLANLVVAAVYAAIGAAAPASSPAVSFLAALVLPGVLLGAAVLARRIWARARLRDEVGA